MKAKCLVLIFSSSAIKLNLISRQSKINFFVNYYNNLPHVSFDSSTSGKKLSP